MSTIDGTGRDVYGKFRSEERVAYALCGKWLLISSNAQALMKIVARYQTRAAIREAGSARWLQHLRSDEQALTSARGFFWADLDEAGLTIKDALAVWRLALEGNRAKRLTHSRVETAEGMMDAVRRLGEITAASEPTPTATKVTVTVGK